MRERVAVDTNACVAWLRAGQYDAPPIGIARVLVLPLPVVGELYAGAFGSDERAQNLEIVGDFVSRHPILGPDHETAVIYGRLRAAPGLMNPRAAKLNDLWIAGVCIQHSLPLLTKDRGFLGMENLEVIHW